MCGSKVFNIVRFSKIIGSSVLYKERYRLLEVMGYKAMENYMK